MRHQFGEIGVLAKPLKTECCSHVIPAGVSLEIVKRTSPQPGNPRIVWVAQRSGPGDGGWHKVKMSRIWFEGESG